MILGPDQKRNEVGLLKCSSATSLLRLKFCIKDVVSAFTPYTLNLFIGLPIYSAKTALVSLRAPVHSKDFISFFLKELFRSWYFWDKMFSLKKLDLLTMLPQKCDLKKQFILFNFEQLKFVFRTFQSSFLYKKLFFGMQHFHWIPLI